MRKTTKVCFFLYFLASTVQGYASNLFQRCAQGLRNADSQNQGPLFQAASPIYILPLESVEVPFSKETFGASNYGQSSNHVADDKFQSWAANTANMGVAARREGKSYREVYDLVIAARANFGDSASSLITFRKPTESIPDNIAWKEPESEKTAHRSQLYPYVAPIVEARSTSENLYTKRDGKRVQLSTVTHTNLRNKNEEPNHILRVSTPHLDSGESILQDISKRLESAEQSTNIDTKIDEFSRAFYGLASLSPLVRGNSAIARVFMTTAAYRIFRKNISLYPDLTIEAMIRSEEQFLDMMRSNLKVQL
jgi:hypothetical protein